MNKPVFKVVDDSGRVLLPVATRARFGIASGDVVSITPERTGISVRKAIVLMDGGKMPVDAKAAYVQAVMRELPPDRLAELLELAVRLIQPDKH